MDMIIDTVVRNDVWVLKIFWETKTIMEILIRDSEYIRQAMATGLMNTYAKRSVRSGIFRRSRLRLAIGDLNLIDWRQTHIL